MSTLSYTGWNVDDVSNWLSKLSLHHLIPNFERMQIDGAALATLSEQDLQSKLRLTKPAERMAIKGAIRKLMEDASRNTYMDQQQAKRMAGTSPRLPVTDRPLELDKIHASKTVPRDHRHTVASPVDAVIRLPKLVQGTASDLLDKEHKYSGWIRKQGGGYKSWKRRYLILRLGCLYYFANETASTAKGSFVLSGYKTEVCRDPEIVKKYRYTLMLIPANPRVRTYYFSVGSQRELMGWKDAIDAEIKKVTRKISQTQSLRQNSADTMSLPSSPGNAYNYDIDDDSEEDPYDVPEGVEGDDDSDHNYDDPESIYDKPDGEADEDDPYAKIVDEFPDLPTFAGRDGKPTVPCRPPQTLPASSISASAPTPSMLTDEEMIESEVTYLPIIGTGPPTDLAAAQPDLSRTMTSSATTSAAPESTQVPRPGNRDSDYEDDAPEENGDEDDDDDGGYYILFRKPEELMPESCLFDRLDRSEADRLLKEKDRDGTYLIRAGSHAGAEKVLSVWHIDRCRHYKLFKDENSSYSLTQGQAFRNIPELLQYYTLQSHLPRSDFYLGEPFNPNDY